MKKEYICSMDKKQRHERILDCRYYNGDDHEPTDDNDSLFWNYEREWVNGEHDNWDGVRNEIIKIGLSDWLYNNDGTDSDFKCMLFNRYCHWVGICEKKDFIKWYKNKYVGSSLTNRQRRANIRRPKLIAKCRYYNGETENPYEGTDDEMKWYYESCWVKQLSGSYERARMFRREVGNHFDDIAKKYDIPRSLIGLFFNRYEYWCTMGNVNIEYFRDWLLYDYLKIKE